MKIELNNEHVELLKNSLIAYAHTTKKELAKWQTEIDAEDCVKSCKRELELIREIENMIYV